MARGQPQPQPIPAAGARAELLFPGQVLGRIPGAGLCHWLAGPGSCRGRGSRAQLPLPPQLQLFPKGLAAAAPSQSWAPLSVLFTAHHNWITSARNIPKARLSSGFPAPSSPWPGCHARGSRCPPSAGATQGATAPKAGPCAQPNPGGSCHGIPRGTGALKG